MGDLFGVSRTIDHAVYTILNSIAMILWRIDVALIQFSMFSYATGDWLMGRSGGDGMWAVMDKMIGANGIFGVSTWSAFLALALTIYGFSLLIRPFWRVQAVDIGRLFIFAVLSYSLITEGSSLMRSIEDWRGEAGGYMYEIVADSGGSVDLGIPGASNSNERVNNPQDLDSRAPIRGWEAVATSYFLVSSADELHDGVPPEEFRQEYCLYDPSEKIEDQADENGEGCSPKKAWDEWDLVSTGAITEVWGIPLPIDVGVSVPIIQEHPENRELGIRQAQAGVARLALGPLVALLPLLEANIQLMLALAAAFIYLSLPLTMLFSFFRYTEPLVNRLIMQFINIILRTFILNGVFALLLMLLINVSINGSMMTYLGLVGVGIIGGFFLSKMAASTMTETISTSLGGLTTLWVGAATSTLGEGARQPALATAGALKWGAAGAMVGLAGRGMFDMWEGARQVARSGSQDLNTASPETMQTVDNQLNKAVGGLPTPIAKMAQSEVNEWTAQPTNMRGAIRSAASANQSDDNSWMDLGSAAVGAVGGYLLGSYRDNTDRNDQLTSSQTSQPASGWGGYQGGLTGTYMGDGRSVETWANQVYQARERGQGERQVLDAGQSILGENLGRQAYQTMVRHRQEETMAVLQATRQAAADVGGISQLIQSDGTLTSEGVQLVRGRLDGEVAETFSGRQGERDLETLIAAGLQPQKRAEPSQFREVASRASKWQGDEAAGRMVPRSLGLDPVASGSNFASLNRFTRLNNQAGLDEEQRKQLLEAVRQEGEISSELRREIEASLRRQQERGLAATMKVDDLIDSARSMPDTLEGPMLIRHSKASLDKEDQDRASVGLAKGTIGDQPDLPNRLTGLEAETKQATSEIGREARAQKLGKALVGDRIDEVRKSPGDKEETKRAGQVVAGSQPAQGFRQIGQERPEEPKLDTDRMVGGASGLVKGVTSPFLADEETKEKGFAVRQQREQRKDALPSLKQLDEDESLISSGATGFTSTRKVDPAKTGSPPLSRSKKGSSS